MMGMLNKTGRLGVRGLNRLQRTGTLPVVWIPPGEVRDQRELSRRRMVLTCQRTQLKNRIQAILKGPEPEVDGVSAWTRADLCRWLEARFGKSYHPSIMTRVLRRMGFSRQKARPVHPKADPVAQESFKKRGFAMP